MGDKTSCTCPKCVRACRHTPGWMTPEEAARAIDAGLGERLMVDWWVRWPGEHAREDGKLLLLCPASRGSEGDFHRDWYGDDWDPMAFFSPPKGKGACTFLTKEERCSIHDSGHKPIECREVMVCGNEEDYDGLHENVAGLWATEEAQALVARWVEERGLGWALEENEDD